MMTKVVSAHTLDPSGPFRTRFGVFYGRIKISQRSIKVVQKRSKMSPGLAGAPYGVPNIKVKRVGFQNLDLRGGAFIFHHKKRL